jgi:hypothetical protein
VSPTGLHADQSILPVSQYATDFQTIRFRDELVSRQRHQAIDNFLGAGAFPACQQAG